MRAHGAKSNLPPALTPGACNSGRVGEAGLPPHPAIAGRTGDLAVPSRGGKSRREERTKPPLRHAVQAEPPAILLVCGNTLRQDDGVGLRIAEAVEQLFPASRLRIVAAQQFTPEMAADIAETELAIFVDACASDEPGAIRVLALAAPSDEAPVRQAGSHGLEPAALLGLAKIVCGHAPARAFAVTVGAGCFGYGERLSGELRQAVPRAVRLVRNLVEAFAPKAPGI